MDFLISIFLVLIGFLLLIKGADVFVEGASKLARRFGIPSIIIGLTIVAIGTSLPELIVSITSSFSGKNDMSIANVTGSNLFNICIVLASSFIIMKTKYTEKISIGDKISNFFKVTFLISGDITSRFIILSNLILLVSAIIDKQVGRLDALLLLFVLVLYIISLIKSSKSAKSQEEKEDTCDINILKQLFLIGISSFAIIFGGDLVVENASKIGEFIGLSENVIGLTIVAVGTSLPELVTSIVAIKKGETDIALGNALGSNIMNILLVVGLSSLISPIAVSAVTLTDLIIVFIVTLFAATTLYKRKNILSKNIAILYVLFYICYISYTIIR